MCVCVCVLCAISRCSGQHHPEDLQDGASLVAELAVAHKHVYQLEISMAKTRVSVIEQSNRGNDAQIDPGNTLIWLQWRMSGLREYKPA